MPCGRGVSAPRRTCGRVASVVDRGRPRKSKIGRFGFTWRLAWIHRAYASILLFMAVSGFLLYLPSLRAPLAPVRVALKELHIAAGVAGALLLLVYLIHAVRHWRTLSRWLGRRLNLVVAVLLAVGWTVSGVVLWWDRALLPWTYTALWWHDILTWIGVPYLTLHAWGRWRRIDLGLPWAGSRKARKHALPTDPTMAAYHQMQATKRRRLFLFAALQLGAVASLVGVVNYLQRSRGLSAAGPTVVKGGRGAATPYEPLPTPSSLSRPPVGGGARGRFRIYNVARAPFWFDQERWRLNVDGLVDRPLTLTWPEVEALERDVWVRDFHCVSGWSVYNVTWEGIPLTHLLDRVGVRPEATHVKFYSYDGVYTDALTLEQARLDDVILAVLKDGNPLSHDEGGPVRLFVSRMFGYKSVKWLSQVELIDHPHRGFWERLGYDENAWIPGVPQTGPLPKVRR